MINEDKQSPLFCIVLQSNKFWPRPPLFLSFPTIDSQVIDSLVGWVESNRKRILLTFGRKTLKAGIFINKNLVLLNNIFQKLTGKVL